ncbi:uncharacterized protein LOC120401241 [Mauremys reevesii]|uniref:uncharacterized protein LOC120401241 n=1 Tax=Mauremys reevesii TaxID=260615 RepID=UPI00193EF7FA|nr:uncharacterized protein LOC120401241 [Mauremys reevesii]
MEGKKRLCFQSDQQLQKIQQLEAELKTARDLLKESQNYAEEMKNKYLSQEIELKEKQAEITHLQKLSAAELASLKKEMINIKAQQKKMKEQLNISLHENEQLSKPGSLFQPGNGTQNLGHNGVGIVPVCLSGTQPPRRRKRLDWGELKSSEPTPQRVKRRPGSIKAGLPSSVGGQRPERADVLPGVRRQEASTLPRARYPEELPELPWTTVPEELPDLPPSPVRDEPMHLDPVEDDPRIQVLMRLPSTYIH